MHRLLVWGIALSGALCCFHPDARAQQELEAPASTEPPYEAADDARLRLTLRKHAWRVGGALVPWDASVTGSAAGEIWTSGIHDSRMRDSDRLNRRAPDGVVGPAVLGAVGLSDHVELGGRVGLSLAGWATWFGAVDLQEMLREWDHTAIALRQYFATSGPFSVGGGLGVALRHTRGRLFLDTGLNIEARGDRGANDTYFGPWRALVGFDLPLALTWVLHPRVRLGGHLAVGLQLEDGDPSLTLPLGVQCAVVLFPGLERVDIEGWVTGGMLPIIDEDPYLSYRVTMGIRILGGGIQ